MNYAIAADAGAGRVVAYALPAVALAFAALPLYVHAPPFYAATTTLDLATLGLLLLAALLLWRWRQQLETP